MSGNAELTPLPDWDALLMIRAAEIMRAARAAPD